MGNDLNSPSDPVWDAAWSWVTRQHERETFDESAQMELARWLQAEPSHRQAYDKASRLWLLAGLVPPASDIDMPGCAEPDVE
jgi:transmembrane sensor